MGGFPWVLSVNTLNPAEGSKLLRSLTLGFRKWPLLFLLNLRWVIFWLSLPILAGSFLLPLDTCLVGRPSLSIRSVTETLCKALQPCSVPSQKSLLLQDLCLLSENGLFPKTETSYVRGTVLMRPRTSQGSPASSVNAPC